MPLYPKDSLYGTGQKPKAYQRGVSGLGLAPQQLGGDGSLYSQVPGAGLLGSSGTFGNKTWLDSPDYNPPSTALPAPSGDPLFTYKGQPFYSTEEYMDWRRPRLYDAWYRDPRREELGLRSSRSSGGLTTEEFMAQYGQVPASRDEYLALRQAAYAAEMPSMREQLQAMISYGAAPGGQPMRSVPSRLGRGALLKRVMSRRKGTKINGEHLH